MKYITEFKTARQFVDTGLLDIYSDQIIGLIKSCFGYHYSRSGIKDMIQSQNGIIYVVDPAMVEEKELVGIVFLGHDNVQYIDPEKTEIDEALLEKYVLKKGFEGADTLFFPSEEDSDSSIVMKDLYPVIMGYCRKPDERYKGLGTYMLERIIEVYRQLNYSKIYAIIESRSGIKDGKIKDCGLIDYDYNDRDTEFYRTNMKLIKYYESIGFKNQDNHYFVNFCNENHDYIVMSVVARDI